MAPMNAAQALKKLDALGTAQNRKIYARHGVRGECSGVSCANLLKLAKELAPDTELARALWASGNHDARVLATMIAEPEELTAAELEAWARALDNYALTDALAKLAARSPHARKLFARWIASKKEWIASAGWGVFSWMLHSGTEFPEDDLQELLDTIEKHIHTSANRVRYAMNGALIGIGVASAPLRAETLATARRIGPVEVDHGETGCKTPDAGAYIAKVVAHQKTKKKARART